MNVHFEVRVNRASDLNRANTADAISLSREYLSVLQFQTLTQVIASSLLLHLELQYTNVAQRGFAALCEVLPSTLVLLDLSGNYLSDDDLQTLTHSSLPRLEVLRLAYNRISTRGAEALIHSLANSQGLRVLDLEANRIESEFDITPLAQLSDLNLLRNSLSQIAWLRMLEQMKTLNITSLHLSKIEIKGVLSDCIATIVNRGCMDTCQFEDVSVDSWHSLEGLGSCRSLQLTNTSAFAMKLQGLQCLTLAFCSLSARDFRVLALSFPALSATLTHLNLAGNACDYAVADVLRIHLNKLFSLVSLDLSNMCSENENFQLLLQGVRCKGLHTLLLGGNMQTRDRSLEVHRSLAGALEYCENLQRVDLSDNQWESLTEFSHHLALKAEAERETLDELSGFHQLQWLNLSELNLSVQHSGSAFHLSTLILANCALSLQVLDRLVSDSLKVVDFSATVLSREAVATLLRALSSSLESLTLAYTCCGDAGCYGLADRACELSALQSLGLGHCGVTDTGAEKLLGVLGDFSALRHLDLSGNAIEGHAFEYAGSTQSSFLATLDLRENPIPESLHRDLQRKFPGLVSLLVTS